MKKISLIMGMFTLLALTACGGGGGGSAPPAAGSITYSGATTPATVTNANANSLSGTTLSGASGATVLTGASAKSGKHSNMSSYASVLAGAARDVARHTPVVSGVAAGAIVNVGPVTTNGSGGGTATITGQIDDVTLTGTITITFANYSNNVEKLNGTITMTISAYDLTNSVPTDATITFTNIQMTQVSSGFTDSLGGSIRLQTNLISNQEVLTVDFVLQDSTGWQGMLQNFVITAAYDNVLLPTTVSETLTGRVYDSIEGYVAITTPIPMVIVNLSTDLYPTTGQIVLTGANGTVGGPTRVRATSQSATTVLIEADTTGDGAYDYSSGVILWSSL